MEETPTIPTGNVEEGDGSGDKEIGIETKSSSRYAQYFKQGIKPKTQEERRNILLKELKTRRNDQMDHKRGLQELFEQDDSEQMSEEPIEQIELMDVDEKRIKSKKQKFKLMLSEWMNDVPSDLEDSWLIKFCPKGFRRMIIAHKHKTISFDKFGVVRKKFNSLLPGGDRMSNGHNFTVLDCIYCTTQKCYYVLDILSWNSFSFIKCSAEFRFFFLKSKLYEHPHLEEVSSWNEYKFIEIPAYPSQLPILENKLSVPFEVDGVELKLDGVLFYYKEMYYKKGYSPFFAWLKPYMIPEVLNLPIAVDYMSEKPEKYTTLSAHLEYTATKAEEKKKQLEEQAKVTKDGSEEILDEFMQT